MHLPAALRLMLLVINLHNGGHRQKLPMVCPFRLDGLQYYCYSEMRCFLFQHQQSLAVLVTISQQTL